MAQHNDGLIHGDNVEPSVDHLCMYGHHNNKSQYVIANAEMCY